VRRSLAAALLGLVLGLLAAATAVAAGPSATRSALAGQMRWAGGGSGALVVDLETGDELYALRPDTPRIPASVEKLYTTTAALLTLGEDATLDTTVLASAPPDLGGVVDGDLYLRGSGDPTLDAGDLALLAAKLVAETGLTAVTGRVVGDESAFDARRGPPSSGYNTSGYVGPLGALVVNRGRTGKARPYFQASPARWAAGAFAKALRAQGVDVSAAGRSGTAPVGAPVLATWSSPAVSALVKLANVPSDNFIAETLIKALGAAATPPGSTAGGAAVVRTTMTGLGIRPQVADGSGLSRSNRTSPRQVVSLLAQMVSDQRFFDSLAIAGRSGTLRYRVRRTAARGRCRGKTGTLISVSNVAGYCRTADGRLLAFAILMNGVTPWRAHVLQDRMMTSLARMGT
jgi:D-alanyl-D-alanine carboxypeptidase/D-alanyl-D-alanine-endopeptidase (penicillin-binding protein 4)